MLIGKAKRIFFHLIIPISHKDTTKPRKMTQAVLTPTQCSQETMPSKGIISKKKN